MHSPLFHLGMCGFVGIGGGNSPPLPLSTKDTFSYLLLSWSPFIPEFPRVFVDTASVGAVLGGGINHMAGSRSAMQNMISCNTSIVTLTRCASYGTRGSRARDCGTL